jgi:hypothetical protein
MMTQARAEVTFQAPHAGNRKYSLSCRFISKRTDSDNRRIGVGGPQNPFMSDGTGMASQPVRSRLTP